MNNAVLVKLGKNKKGYEFNNSLDLKVGDKVYCDTAMGYALGTVLEVKDVAKVATKWTVCKVMKLFKITPKVHKYYQNKINGNKDASESLTRRKLTRNIQLALKSKTPFENENLELYHYGNLDILVDPKKHKIVSIKNFKGASAGWFVKDVEMYEKLNQHYGISILEEDMKAVQ